MINFLINNAVRARSYFVYQKYYFLAAITNQGFSFDSNANFVISIASYPKRDHLLPAVFEALSRQSVKPKKAILVLSKEEYPRYVLPQHLLKLEQKGIEIIWTEKNSFAVKKMVPVIKKYPELAIITFDDELLYGKTVVAKLVEASEQHKSCIIGHVGKALHRRGPELGMFFRDMKPASLKTDSSQVYFLGGSGTFYPPNSLDSRVIDISAINQIVPGRGSDIWFWAAAVAAGTKQICLGTPTKKELYIEIPQNKKTEPRDTPGLKVMEERFQKAIDYFGIREKLLNQLPDKGV